MEIEERHVVRFDTEWNVEGVRRLLHEARRAVLVSHTNADGDAVGAVTGMYGLLAEMKLLAAMLLPDGVPDDLQWLPYSDLVLCGKDARAEQLITEADLIIGLDISGPSRTGCLEPWIRASQARKMLVDHHEAPEREVFDVVISEPRASSTCELVYWLAVMLSSEVGSWRSEFGVRSSEGHPSDFRTLSATCLYTGMCTDTGTFSYSNERQSLYLAAANLLQFGIDPMAINRQIKNVFTEARLRFFGYAIAHKLTVYTEQAVALMVLTAQDMAAAGVQSHELTGLINEVMKLKDVDCGILVREEEGKVRLSLRSKTRYDVNLLAGEMFGGGGHKRAAGATSKVSLDETVTIIKQRLGLER